MLPFINKDVAKEGKDVAVGCLDDLPGEASDLWSHYRDETDPDIVLALKSTATFHCPKQILDDFLNSMKVMKIDSVYPRSQVLMAMLALLVLASCCSKAQLLLGAATFPSSRPEDRGLRRASRMRKGLEHRTKLALN